MSDLETFLGKEESWDDYIASKNGTVNQTISHGCAAEILGIRKSELFCVMPLRLRKNLIRCPRVNVMELSEDEWKTEVTN